MISPQSSKIISGKVKVQHGTKVLPMWSKHTKSTISCTLTTPSSISCLNHLTGTLPLTEWSNVSKTWAVINKLQFKFNDQETYAFHISLHLKDTESLQAFNSHIWDILCTGWACIYKLGKIRIYLKQSVCWEIRSCIYHIMFAWTSCL